ncbi:sialoadhesin-like [Scleropages formosus]|uniref:sialoadhesin-like n=1 Tax=Scleropages formosus TaxID=113540 RepID=UPI0010FA70A2|nr:sialoadhesin-like [Scleropages formosus]
MLVVSEAWTVKMPPKMTGMKDSCLVIPCSFYYSTYPASNPLRIVWYQYVSRGYPLVYDKENPSHVIHKFRGKTELYERPKMWTCSLKINRLEPSHHGEKIYTWVDPGYVTYRYYKFYDTTVEIDVAVSAEKPELTIVGEPELGKQMTALCTVYHTCPPHPPELTIIGPSGTDVRTNKEIYEYSSSQPDGLKVLWYQYKTEGYPLVYDKESPVNVIDKFRGSVEKVVIDPKPSEFVEGVMQIVTCLVSYICGKEITVSWNYEDMQNELEFPVTQLSGIWQTSTGGYVYHNGQTEVLDNFKGRTKIIGNMDEQNCTLEIDDVKALSGFGLLVLSVLVFDPCLFSSTTEFGLPAFVTFTPGKTFACP